MTTTTHKVLCGACKCALEGPAKPQPHDMITCPCCGQHDTFDAVMREVKEYVGRAASESLGKSLADSMRGSKFVTVTSKLPPKRQYRFIADVRL